MSPLMTVGTMRGRRSIACAQGFALSITRRQMGTKCPDPSGVVTLPRTQQRALLPGPTDRKSLTRYIPTI